MWPSEVRNFSTLSRVLILEVAETSIQLLIPDFDNLQKDNFHNLIFVLTKGHFPDCIRSTTKGLVDFKKSKTLQNH